MKYKFSIFPFIIFFILFWILIPKLWDNYISPAINSFLTRNNITPYVFWGSGYSSIGIVEKNKKVQYYNKASSVGKWVVISGKEFVLPNEFKEVIGFDENNIGIILEDKIQFYLYNGSWKIIPDKEFLLPVEYKKIISLSNKVVGVLIDNKIVFYSYDKNWDIIPNIDFILPEGYFDVVGIVEFWLLGDKNNSLQNIDSSNITEGYHTSDNFVNILVGVLINGKYQTYRLIRNNNINFIWSIISSRENKIPNGYKSLVSLGDSRIGINFSSGSEKTQNLFTIYDYYGSIGGTIGIDWIGK